ncbi:MAG TPA: argininosuccinate lyase [Fimbriimonadaceae bacterium]|nr:argininosuccinate lyase [Fimbriimonadaceae bacterium]
MADKHKLWGAAFSKAPNEVAWRFGQSIESDLNLLNEEIQVSIVHAQTLAQAGILSKEECQEVVAGLQAVRSDLSVGSVRSDISGFEDIHALIEAKLKEKVGVLADKLHAGRSRNDQIVTVTTLWVRHRIRDLWDGLEEFQKVIVEVGERWIDEPMPGYTHQQTAQPITLGYHLLAYAWMAESDFQRLTDLYGRLRSPLGSGALAGSTLPLDRHFAAESLDMMPVSHALDAVSSRDFVGDMLHACATVMQHLSRLAQELVLFSTAEFDFVRLDDSMSTGSSIMPQKRNPDFAELIRGRSSRALGNYVTFMSMMRALPLGYNRDQQDDKPPLFDSVGLCLESLSLCTEMIRTAEWNLPRLKQMATAKFSTATAIAEALVLEGLPFRQAHEAVGKTVIYCEQHSKALADLEQSDADALGLSLAALRAGTLESALDGKQTYGSPGKVPRRQLLHETKQILNASLPDLEDPDTIS